MVESLGKALSLQELAEILNCDVRFVRRHYAALGGIRLGPRKIVFFEKEIERAIQAQRRESEKAMGGATGCEWPEQTGHLRHQTGSQGMGKRPGKIVSLVDSHNIFG